MPREAAVRHLQVLCHLPLTQLGLVKALSEAMHDVVSSRWNVGGIFHAVGVPGPGYGELVGYQVMASRWQTECAPYFAETLTIEDLARVNRVGQTLAIQRPGYEQSDVYRKVFRPFGVKWFLDISVQDEEGMLAGFMLLRGPAEGRFTKEDCDRIEAILPSIVQGFRDSRKREAATIEQLMPVAPSATASGYALVSQAGQVRGMTRPARHIFEMMTAEAAQLDTYAEKARSFIAEVVAAVIAQTGTGRDGQSGGRLARRIVNGLGEFRLSVASLEAINLPEGIPPRYEILPHDGPDEPVRSLMVEYREPLALHLARAMRQAGLSPGQVHIGVLVSLGKSQSEVADEIGVKRSSVDDAVRKIYARTGVHSAIELAWHFAGRSR